MPSNRYGERRESWDCCDARVIDPYSSKKRSSLPKMDPEKRFHLAMNDALMQWKAEVQEQHEAEIDQLEGKHRREIQKLRRGMTDMIEKDTAHQAMEEMSRQDQAEIEKLRQQVSLLKKGWKKEREEWQNKKKTLEKDLEPTSWWGL